MFTHKILVYDRYINFDRISICNVGIYILCSSYFSAFFHNYEKPTQSSETPAKTNIATAKNPLTKKKLVSQRLEQLVHHEWCC